MLNSKKITLCLSFMVCALYMLFYFYDYLLQTSFSILPNTFFTKHDIDAQSFGLLSAAFFYGYMLFQIPLGFCLDRIGLKPTSLLCVVSCFAGTLLFFTGAHYYSLFIARFLIGASNACACVLSIYAIKTWLAKKYFSVGVGMVQAAGCMGSIFGQAIGAMMIKFMGFATLAHFLIYFPLGLLAIYLFIPKKKSFTQNNDTIRLKNLKRVFANKQVISIAALGFISWGPVSVLAANWMVRLLNHDLGWAHDESANLLISFWVGLALASLFVGKFSDYIQSRRKVVLFTLIIQGICCMILATFSHINYVVLFSLLFLLGAASSLQTFSFVLISESVSKSQYGTTAAFVNMAAVASGALLNPLFGWIVSHLTIQYKALWLFPLLSFTGVLVCWFMLNETYADEDSVVQESFVFSEQRS